MDHHGLWDRRRPCAAQGVVAGHWTPTAHGVAESSVGAAIAAADGVAGACRRSMTTHGEAIVQKAHGGWGSAPQVSVPKPSDDNFTAKIVRTFAQHPRFFSPKIAQGVGSARPWGFGGGGDAVVDGWSASSSEGSPTHDPWTSCIVVGPGGGGQVGEVRGSGTVGWAQVPARNRRAGRGLNP